jgi:hypothetical protein
MLGYCDGDVRDLQGIHFYDDTKDANTSPSYVFLQEGATHNSYNTVWSYPDYCCHGRIDEWDGSLHNVKGGGGVPGGAEDVSCKRSARLSPQNQRSSSLAYITAFLYTFLTADDAPTRYKFYPHLTGAADPPSAVQQANAKIHVTYNPGLTLGIIPDMRRDINALSSTYNLTTNSLGGAVTYQSISAYGMCGPGAMCETPVPYFTQQYDPRQPHSSSASPWGSTLQQLRLDWSTGSAR